MVAGKERVNGVVGSQWPWLSLLRDGGREECFRNAKRVPGAGGFAEEGSCLY